MIGHTYQSRTDPKAQEEYGRYWQSMMNGEKIKMRTTIVRPDGRPVICEISSAPIKRGNRTFVFAIVRDVTAEVQEGERLVRDREELERRVAERTAELQKSEERFRASFTQGGIGMALVALDGRFLQVNRAFCQIFGYSEAEVPTTRKGAWSWPGAWSGSGSSSRGWRSAISTATAASSGSTCRRR